MFARDSYIVQRREKILSSRGSGRYSAVYDLSQPETATSRLSQRQRLSLPHVNSIEENLLESGSNDLMKLDENENIMSDIDSTLKFLENLGKELRQGEMSLSNGEESLIANPTDKESDNIYEPISGDF